jgi:long-subunit acyl-CoA synthetase (AMP-forming)
LRERTLCGAFQRTAASIPDQVALRSAGGAHQITWADYAARVRALAGGIAAAGIRPGDVIALMLTNRPEHNVIDAAAMHLGATPFSIYATSPASDIRWLLEQSQAQLVFTEPAFADRVADAVRGLPCADGVILVADPPGALGARSLAELEATPAPDGFNFEATWRAIEPQAPVTLIYTSGTTGLPKGVQHSHASVLFMLRSLDEVAPVSPGGRVVSFLPMAHIAERFISHYSSMAFGFTVTTVADQRRLAAALPEVRPTRLFAVPRIYEKLKAGLDAAIAALPAEPQSAARGAIAAGLARVRAEQAGEPVPDEIAKACAEAEPTVFADLRTKLGLDQLEWPSVGAAPTPYGVLEFFHAIGVPIQELWGMSEVLLVTINPPERIKLGTAGPAMPGVRMRLADDGEVLIGGGSLMVGYKDRDDLTAQTVIDGWVHTGDIGQLDADGYLSIVDRKKELIINSAGKNMAPSRIEGELKQSSPLIGHAICVGDRRLYNVALLTLDLDAAASWAAANGRSGASIAELAADARVKTAVAEGVALANTRLARVEQIKSFRLLADEWLPGSDQITPTLKLRRRAIEQKYAAVIDALYREPEPERA